MTRTRMLLLLSVLLAAAGFAAGTARAVLPDEMLADSTLETRARSLSRELRCMVCQNQSIDDSEAPLARDLRVLVRERLKSGDSDQQVLEFLTARYGNFVLLKPPLEWTTMLLWFGPPALLIAGALALVVAARRRSALAAAGTGQPAPLTAAEEARLAALLGPALPHEHTEQRSG